MRFNNINCGDKSEFTRRCIGEAILRMMKTTEFAKLKVSEIAKMAGVSRTTFYNYYNTPYQVLADYLNIIVSEYIANSEKSGNTKYFEYSHIVYSLHFFDQYAEYFLTLSKQKLHSIMFEGINAFMMEHVRPESGITIYRMYSYAGALLNIFLKWEEGGKKERVEDVANTLMQVVNA